MPIYRFAILIMPFPGYERILLLLTDDFSTELHPERKRDEINNTGINRIPGF